MFHRFGKMELCDSTERRVLFVCLKKEKKIMLMKVLRVWYKYKFLTSGFILYSLLKIHCKLQSKPFCYTIYITDVHSNL